VGSTTERRECAGNNGANTERAGTGSGTSAKLQLGDEALLTDRSQPPPSFQPVLPQTSTPASGAARTNVATQTTVPTHRDLITRYKLQDKISGASASDVQAGANEPQKRPAWSQNKAERQQLLQKRREDMILAARRKMEEKDRAVKTS